MTSQNVSKCWQQPTEVRGSAFRGEIPDTKTGFLNTLSMKFILNAVGVFIELGVFIVVL